MTFGPNHTSDKESTVKIKMESEIAYFCDDDLCNNQTQNFFKIILDLLQGKWISTHTFHL